MAERIAAVGYVAVGKQTNSTTPIAPTIFTPYYKQSLQTLMNVIEDNPVYGGKFKAYQALPGQRAHKGSLTVMAEPNSIGQWFDMLLTKSTSVGLYTFTVTSANATIGATFSNNSQTFTVVGTITAGTTLVCTGTGAPTASGTLTKVTGTGDATITFSAFSLTSTQHTFGLSSTTDPNSYTLDVSLGSQVYRYWGVQANKVVPNWQGDEMQLEVGVSALGAFQGRSIATVVTTTLTLDTSYDPAPNKGLVVGDLVRIEKVDGSSTLDTTIATVNSDGITVTLAASAAAFAAGDMIVLRPATPSLSVLTPFLWPKTQYFFSADAATALTSSATPSNQTRLEQGVSLDIMHDFASDDGSGRSGSFDPASLIRTRGDYSFKIKQFFDTPADLKSWLNLTKKACVMRAYSGANNQYEFRVTMNNLKLKTENMPTASDEVIYQEQEFATSYDPTDGVGITVTINNANATI